MRRIPILIAAAALGGALAAIFLLDPARTVIYPPCVFHVLTGLYCPGCGSTRALHQLTHGHLLAALQLNGLFVLSLPVLGGACLWQVTRLKSLTPLLALSAKPILVWLALALIIAFGILRNVPVAPFSWLAP